MKHCLLSILNIHDLNFVNDKGIQGLTAGSSALDIRYQYDVRGQLLEECRNGAAVRYAYDAAGNRIQKTENKKETRYRYNQKNQLLQKEDADGISCFTYDRQGGIIEEKNAAGNRRFTYNSLHQQTQVETETGNIQKNRYDAEGLRYELIENGRRTSFVYYNGELLHEKGEEAGLSQGETSYHLGAGIEAFQRDRKTFYYHQDEQLNTALISDEKAASKNHYQYDAFGAGLEAVEALPNRIRYTGQQYDEQTGQYYLRARYYNPILGRFMQEDVYHGDGLNLFTYCANNPVIYYDPSGYVLSQADLNKILRDSNSPNNYAYYQNKTHRGGFKSEDANPSYYEGKSFQSHHLLQGEWALSNLDIYGYDYYQAPTLSLGTGWYKDKNNIQRRAPHTIANNRQQRRANANNRNFKLTNLNEELLFGAQDLYIAGLSKELILSELKRNYKYLDSLNELKKTEIDSGKLKPIEYDRKKIESELDEFMNKPHDDESIKSKSCKSKKKK
jgi:RHS repeat-associated protein